VELLNGLHRCRLFSLPTRQAIAHHVH